MNTEIKTKSVAVAFTLVKNPELVKVKTISPKIVEQLPQRNFHQVLDGEILGKTAYYHQLIIRKDDQLCKVDKVDAVMYLIERGMTNDQAHAQLNALPQLFEV
jgi:hypothetical protein